MTTDKSLIANNFCKYFANVAVILKTKSIQLRDFIWSRPVAANPINHVKVNFVFRAAVNEAKVLKDLKRLKRKKATGLDDLPSGLLKHAAPVIEKPVTFIINLSLHGKCLLNGKWLKCCHSSNLGLHYIAKPDSYIHRTR